MKPASLPGYGVREVKRLALVWPPTKAYFRRRANVEVARSRGNARTRVGVLCGVLRIDHAGSESSIVSSIVKRSSWVSALSDKAEEMKCN